MAFSFRPVFRLLRRRLVFIPLLVIAAGFVGWRVYAAYHPATEVSYVTAPARLGNLIITAKGSGQVSSSNQVDVKPKVSGTIVALLAKEGSAVKAGAAIAYLDASSARRTLRDAETSLETAQLALQQLQQPTDALTLLQSENALAQAIQNKNNAEDSLVKAYDDGFNAVANAFLQLPTVMSGMDAVMNGKTADTAQNVIDAYADVVDSLNPSTILFKTKAVASYVAARQSYDIAFRDYKSSSRYASQSDVESLLNETYGTVKTIAESVKNTKNFVDYVADTLTTKSRKLPSTLAGHQADLQTYTGTTNTQLGAVLSAVNAITNNKQTIVNGGRTIEEKTASLAKLKEGPDALDLRAEQLSIEQRKNAVADARLALVDYAVLAPFAGRITKVTAKVGDQVSGSIATLLSPTLLASVSLNEVDIVNVKVGQKSSITFDALTDVKATGTVAEVDALGTTSQGVVTYVVKIALDKTDDRVKPGMNVSAAITTAENDGVIVVSSSAVHAGRNGFTVQVMQNGQPASVDVETGLTNDTQTEITSGLNEGDVIVVRTVTAATASSTASTRSGASAIPGLGGGNSTFIRAGGTAGGFRPPED